MSKVLIAKELSRHYHVSRGFMKGQATVKALNNVSFGLEAGRTLAVVGESGCGKSTLARQLTMVEQPTSGHLTIDGVDIAAADSATLKKMRPTVQMVFQNPYASLNPRKQIGAVLDEPLLINTSLSKAERDDKVKAIMAKVGLRPEHFHRYPHMFSGGQRQRVAIARAMILNPKIVVADEPVSALDVSIQAQILNLFMDLQDEFKIAYVFISHNLAVVEHVADDVMVMYLGSTVEYGQRDKIYSRPLHPYTQALLSATPAIREEDRRQKIKIQGELPSPLNPPSGCAFHKRCPHAVDRCKQEVPMLRTIDERIVACHRVEEIN
ncbi:dipeptide transport system ATP-binding protein [Chitinivorax tropicus]|uniref:Dipeptide transport system ATP-binding protein n=1 Tax=Chitinivorax tropicus TaxID=714531 RepID=A0A840MND0_9PROT|nr:peptide ABC transporter ATP-binding protein [Chitinivorax tropicus]MBB5018252.1 dipeptide transport system ATP-binding protein [Chitinivorax tropicus]